MIRTLIVDDEPLARQGLQLALSRERDIEIVGALGDGLLAISFLRTTPVDLLLLDIEMPGLDGLEIARQARGAGAPLIIFVTAFDQYAVRAFDRDAIDYLVKPVAPLRLAQALQRARSRLSNSTSPELPVHPGVSGVSELGDIPTSEILWIEAEDYYVRIHTRHRTMLRRDSLSALEQRLNPKEFRRIHRSAIVARQFAERFDESGAEPLLVLKNASTLKVGRTYLAAVRDWLRTP